MKAELGPKILGVIKYLVNQFKLTRVDIQSQNNIILRWVSTNGHLDVVQYLR